jgi:hypothetical protein
LKAPSFFEKILQSIRILVGGNTMSLRYGISEIGEEDYKALPECVKNFYHEGLPFWMMFTGVPYLVAGTIPVIVERMKLGYLSSYTPFEKDLKENGLTVLEVLTALQGFTANVTWLTNAQFLTKLGKTLTKLPAKYDPWSQMKELKRDSFALAAISLARSQVSATLTHT